MNKLENQVQIYDRDIAKKRIKLSEENNCCFGCFQKILLLLVILSLSAPLPTSFSNQSLLRLVYTVFFRPCSKAFFPAHHVLFGIFFDLSRYQIADI